MKKSFLILTALAMVFSLFGCAAKPEVEPDTHIHNWQAATCVTPMTCMLCGDTRGFLAGHTFNRGFCNFCSATDPSYENQNSTQPNTPTDTQPNTPTDTQPILPDIPEETVHVHEWVAAGCTIPEYCSNCGKIGNAALGHTYDSGKCKRCGVLQTETSNTHVHNWQAATCITPMTCTTCGATSGSRAMHSYAASTCTTPATCTTCGATSGSPRNHYWKAATCSTPETCYYCGLTRGTVVHSYVTSPFCYKCGTEDPTLQKFSIKQTWSVADSFEFTINSVTQHTVCSSSYASKHASNGYTTAVIIDYTFKNTGTGKLIIDEWCFEVYDGNNIEADALYFGIYCEHDKDATNCTAGGSCTAKLPVAMVNASNKITVYMDVNDNFAKFEVPVTTSDSGSSSGSSGSGSSGSGSSGSSSSGSSSSGSNSSGSGNGTESWNQTKLDAMLDDILQGNAFAGTVVTFANSSISATDSTTRQINASTATMMATECKNEILAALNAAKAGPEIRLTQGDYATVKDALQAAYNLISPVAGLAVTSSNCTTVANKCKTAANQVDAITISILRELVWN